MLQISQWDEAILIAEVGGNHDGEFVGTSVVNDLGHVRVTSSLTW